MRPKLHHLITLVALFGLVLAIAAPVGAVSEFNARPNAPAPVPLAQAGDDPANFQKVPEDIQALFAGGMSVEDFAAMFQGNVPTAVQRYLQGEAERLVTVIVTMEDLPLAGALAGPAAERPASPEAQRAYSEALLARQAPVVNAVQASGGVVIDQYTKAHNGMLVRVPVSQLQELSRLPGVTRIEPAPVFTPNLGVSVPLIGAPQVWQDFGARGEGITIGIIDTGIDYTHAAFGGPGTPDAYATNDPTTLADGDPATLTGGKVAGGYDFAGTNYNASSNDPAENIPQPDPDPLDENGHGTHVASIAAGMEISSTQVYSGVAPAATLYALKVFGRSGSTDLTLSAIEWALDPNGDGSTEDRLDVINMSLGSPYGPGVSPGSAYHLALNYATDIGMIVVTSAGNEGDVHYITGFPGSSSASISTAASNTGALIGPTVSVVTTTAPMTQTNILYATPDFDDDTGHFTETMTGTLLHVGSFTGVITDTLCSTADYDPDALEGGIALIRRGGCGFTVKVNNAAALGAEGAIVFNNQENGNELTTMGGPPVDIPAGFIAFEDGLNLIPAHGQPVEVSAETEVTQAPFPYLPADTMASFSSRGPRVFDGFVKPDITAPGVSIFAAAAGSGNAGIGISGTSMASPHVAGVAALMRQIHPDWSVEQIKAAMMNTAVDTMAVDYDPVTGTTSFPPAPISLTGAGRVDASASVTTTVVAIGDPRHVSVNWGHVILDSAAYSSTKTVDLYNFGGSDVTLDTSMSFGPDSLDDMDGITVTFSDASVMVPAGGTATISVTLDVDVTALPAAGPGADLEEANGYLTFSNSGIQLDVPFGFLPHPVSVLAVDDEVDTDAQTVSATITNTGILPASLDAFTLLEMSPEDVAIADYADLRMFGMDMVVDPDPMIGDTVVPVFHTYGGWNSPNMVEFDLYVDTDQDGVDDMVFFNWYLGAPEGADYNDLWVVYVVDFNAGTIGLGSPYLVGTDFNSSLMVWRLPASTLNLASGTDTDFNYSVYSFDLIDDTADAVGPGYFDYAHVPYDVALPAGPAPGGTGTATVTVADPLGTLSMDPLGVMLVNYSGEPGEGQAFPILFDFSHKMWLPYVARDVAAPTPPPTPTVIPSPEPTAEP